jgi:hypothetical protein
MLHDTCRLLMSEILFDKLYKQWLFEEIICTQNMTSMKTITLYDMKYVNMSADCGGVSWGSHSILQKIIEIGCQCHGCGIHPKISVQKILRNRQTNQSGCFRKF